MTEAIQINTYIIPKCLLLIFTIFPPENKIKNNKKQITKTTGTPPILFIGIVNTYKLLLFRFRL